MGRRAKQENLEAERIRAPKTERSDGSPVYMTVAARNQLKRLE